MKKLFVAIIASVFAAGVYAADQGGIQVGGNLNQTVKTGDNTNRAEGLGATAKQSVGAIEGNVKVGGNLNQTVKTGDNTNTAKGLGATAEQSIGVIKGK